MTIPRQSALIALALLALVAVVHGQAVTFGFVMDDWPQIGDSRLRGHIPLADIFLKGVWGSSVDRLMSDNYRPLFSLWLEAIARLFGPSPAAYHAGAVLLHGANVLLLWRLAGRFASPIAAALGAALFAVHPALVQSVAWVSGATDLLMGLFVLLAVLAHLRWRDSGRKGWLAAIAVAYLAAVLSKEVALVLPALLFTLDRQRGVAFKASLNLAVLAVVPVLWAVLRANALPATGLESNMAFDLRGWTRLADAVAFSLQASVFPWPQFYHLTVEPAPLTSWLVVPALAVWALVAWFARRAMVPLVWFVLFLAPPMVLAFHSVHAWNFRFLYVPLMGAALLIALCRPAIIALAVLAGAVVSPLVAADWRDDGQFYAMVRRSDPASESGYAGMLMHYRRMGNVAGQEEVLAAAVKAVPNPRAHLAFMVDYGNFLTQRGRPRESAAIFQQVAAIPEGRRAGLLGLGVSLWAVGDLPAAMTAFDEAAELAPGDQRIADIRERLRRVMASKAIQ
ncbi:MAG: glycosyltransferase family 39 protein [Rhodospirillaceae bacterium]|nr:glycosyltransferase family 39 protein [Rhodospirillales bacterium]